MPRAVPGVLRRLPAWAVPILLAPVLALLALAGAGRPLAAQYQLSVPFTNGFIGTRGSNAGSADTVKTYATLGIARTFFLQNSSTGQFQVQGNDISGTLRILRTDGTIIDIPAIANWRQNSGQTTYLIGFLPRPTSPVTLSYNGSSIQITDGTNPGGSNIGAYVAAYPGPFATDGSSPSGNAATSGVLNGLNDYLATVASSRPAGPVTVTPQTTASPTPTLAGTATLASGEQLSVLVGGVQYTTASSPAVVRSGTSWSLALTTPLAVGTYDVSAVITDADGFTLSDATTHELTVTAPVTAVTLGGGFTATGKTYDGTLAATGATGGLTLSGVQNGHQVTITAVTLAFQTAAAGAGKTVSIIGVTLGGTHAAQYTVSLAGAPTAAATVAPRPLTVTGVSAASRVYDGTTAATLAGTAAYAGLATGETFAVAGTPLAAFASAAVGTAKPVTVTGYAAPNANYTVAQPAGRTAAITPRPLTVAGSFTASDKRDDGTTTATIATNALTLANTVAGDTVTLTGVTAAFATPGPGTNKPVTLSAAALAGAAAPNYTLSLAGAPTTTATILAAGGTLTLAGTFTASDKVYDGTTAATGASGGLTLAGVQTGDQVTIAAVTLAFQTAAVGTGKTVAVTGITLSGADAAFYTTSLAGAPTTTAGVTPRPLILGGTFTALDKPFDGTTTATIATQALTLPNAVGGDAVALTGLAAAFATPAVGAGKPVTLSAAALTGADAANYTLSLVGAPATTAAVTAVGGTVTLAGTFTANDKSYDGTVAATGTTAGLALSGVQSGDQVTIASVTLVFQTAAVGAGKTVTVTSVTLGGADAGRYIASLTNAPTATAAVTPRALTLAGAFSAADKLVDGTTAATLSASTLQLAGALPNDAVALGPLTAAFADAAVGAGKTVTLTGAVLTGADAANYALSLAGAPTAAANILAATPPSAPIAVGVTPGDRTLALAWSAPAASGCSAVTGYVAEVSADGGATWTRTALTAPGALAGLVNNLGYLVRVAAVNACGTGPFALAAGPVVPVAPTRDGAGELAPTAPGTATVATHGVTQPVAVEVVQDTVLQMTGGAAANAFTLRVRAVDQPGAVIPLDTSRTLLLEHGGRAATDGRGFTPGSVATVYLYAPRGAPLLLGTVPVAADGTFVGSLPVPDTLAAGPYTLQVNGVDRTGAPRAVGLGVEVAAPPPELELAATPSDREPAVGDTITITLAVTNAGRGPAINAVIPRAFTESGFVVLAAAPLDGSYDDRTKVWTIPYLAAGAQARLRFTAVVLPPDPAAHAAPTSTPTAAATPLSGSLVPTPRP